MTHTERDNLAKDLYTTLINAAKYPFQTPSFERLDSYALEGWRAVATFVSEIECESCREKSETIHEMEEEISDLKEKLNGL